MISAYFLYRIHILRQPKSKAIPWNLVRFRGIFTCAD